jgi:glycosyltransferase involved in cell wall biosynthesis
VSVIIPAYNAELELAQALDSVAAQTYADWEVVVGDDGSTDGTAKVAERLGSGLVLVRSEANHGPSTARNLAIAASSGELLAFLDSDDYWLPDYLDHQVRLLDASRREGVEVGIVACDAEVLGPAGRLPRTYLDLIGFEGEVTVTRLLSSNPIFVSAVSPRRVVDEAGGFCADLRAAEDHDLWLRIAELGYAIVVSRAPLAVYRVRGRSLSADPGPMARGTQAVLLRALARGNLTSRQRRIARRELRLQRAVERVAAQEGLLHRGVLSSLPLLARVAVENPRRWPSFARVLATRGGSLHRFDGESPSG